MVKPLICDTSGLLAHFDHCEPAHRATTQAVRQERGPLIVSPLALAELDHFLNTRYRRDEQLAVLGELAHPAWTIAPFDRTDLKASRAVIERYADQRIGLRDASLVVLAERYRTRRILTLDRRHFEALRTARGQSFELVP